MWIAPLVAAVVAFLFAGMLGRRYVERRRPFELLWAIALAMYGVASLALLSGVLGGWSRTTFGIYWALGAVLNVPFLAAGEVVLLVRRPIATWAVALALVFCTALTIAVLQRAAFDPRALAEQLPSGREVLGQHTPAYRLPRLIATPSYLVLIAGTLWSAARMRGRPELRDRFVGTLLVALGATVVAAGAAFSARGMLLGFAATLVAGIGAMFWGFLRAARPAAPRPAAVATAG